MSLGHGASIVRDGLVLHLDAAGVKSYPGSGTTWTDLSGNGNDGTLTNGPTFDSANKGGIVFDGSNDYCDINDSFNYLDFTISLNLKPNSSQLNYADIIDNNHTSNRSWVIQQDNNNTNVYYFWCVYPFGIQFTLDSNVWVNITVVHDNSSQTFSVYKNSMFIDDASSTLVYDSTEFLRIGRWGGGGRYWNGVYGSCLLYNRALTADEIKQNFEATRGRYGI